MEGNTPTPASSSGDLSSFIDSGIYRLVDTEDLKVVFVDPVRLLNESYTRFRVSRSSYYSRSFELPPPKTDKKRKRRRKAEGRELNERERDAEKRHQEVRPFLLKAYESLLGASDLLASLPYMTSDGVTDFVEENRQINFVELGNLWQAPLYEISLYRGLSWDRESQGATSAEYCGKATFPIFNNSVFNDFDKDLESEFLGNRYILPKNSCFHMGGLLTVLFSLTCIPAIHGKSDLRYIHNLIPVHSDNGFNLILVDPPWENASASQKTLYPTLPNRFFLSLPIYRLSHTEGALVALWVTNREKFRIFVEDELFPAWGVTKISSCYWLKVKTDGFLIREMDSSYNRPYECLILGYVKGKHADCQPALPSRYPRNGQIFISVPGAYSRKPPLGQLLCDYIPGQQPPCCIDLFARELQAGCTSWGNEALRFQDSRYFIDKK